MKLTVAAVAGIAAVAAWMSAAAPPRQGTSRGITGSTARLTQGALLVRDTAGRVANECPLKHTSVSAEITGFMARVEVAQEFENTATDTVEAVYVFPLPHDAAVDDMTIHIGDRTVRGTIKRRDEARQIYEAARAAGRTAALLDQERANIFTQSVANIPPGGKVKVVIRYLERLPYEAGTYSFAFPMVVGPRYIPGSPVGRQSGGWAEDTDRVPDASRITPPVAEPGTRAGHDISVRVKLDAGLPLDAVYSPSHDVDLVRAGDAAAAIRLRAHNTIPNKDFVLKYDVAGRQIRDTLLAHRGGQGGYFTLILQPPERTAAAEATPKELVFVLDTSGSMSGFPIEKAKEAMRYALDGLNPRDTFNLITFAGGTHVLFPEPVPGTRENLATAQRFLASRSGGGGTEMMQAIRTALEPSDSREHVRIVCFMTDGYVGNDEEIVAEVKRHPNARVFSFGIGNSVNRCLLAKMAEEGRGEVEWVRLNDDGSAAAKRFHERVRNPLLTDIAVDWGALPVAEVYPRRIPDLFSAKPLVLSGRYSGPAQGTIRIAGRAAGRPFSREIRVDLPTAESRYAVLPQLWARAKVDHLMHAGPVPSAEEITELGLQYRLMTPYTSFVAVDERVVNEGGRLRRVEVPVEMPDGVSYEGVFGEQQMVKVAARGAVAGTFLPPPVVAEAQRRGKDSRSALPVPPPPPASVDKLHPSLRGVQGRVSVAVWLSQPASDGMLAQLKRMGAEVAKKAGHSRQLVIVIDAAQLAAIARLPYVSYLAPAPETHRVTR